MYATMLLLHNLLRWAVLISAVLALATAYIGWFGQRSWATYGKRWSTIFLVAMDVQLLLGILLYFAFSPLGMQAFGNMGMAGVMGNSGVRFFAVEHLAMMVLAVIVAHAGGALIRRAATDRARFRAAAISTTIAVLLVVAAIPWDRPLFRIG